MVAIVYCLKSFHPDEKLFPRYKHMFRVVGLKEYLSKFHSDRSHMKKEDKNSNTGYRWVSPPPNYPPLLLPNMKEGTNLFSKFVNMEDTEIGTIYDIQGLLKWLQ